MSCRFLRFKILPQNLNYTSWVSHMQFLIRRLISQALNKLVIKLLRDINYGLHNILFHFLYMLRGIVQKAKIEFFVLRGNIYKPIIVEVYSK
jgi:hypothetical protein